MTGRTDPAVPGGKCRKTGTLRRESRDAPEDETGDGNFEELKGIQMDYLGKDTFKLGFGLMRLPRLEDGTIDVKQTAEMTDRFLEAGGTYFDTAYAYEGSEAAIRKALVERYPRDSYTLADKLIAFGNYCHDEESAKQEFYTSLERTGAGYFDYYLLHALQMENYQNYDRWHLWDFVKKLKAQGLIRHYGFSFHADPVLLDELLTAHPGAEFVQLQVNYADWDNPGVASRENMEVCKKHGKPVVVMETIKGGILADPIPAVKEIFDKEDSGISYAGWALRFVAGQDNLITALSGMSSLAQMEDNLSCMKDFKSLNKHEMDVIRAAQAAISADKSIACTACHYCTGGCPMGIPIPEIFNVQNRKKGSPEFRTRREYAIVTKGKGKAGDCIQCGQCENVCPQHLPIINLLEQCRALE